MRVERTQPGKEKAPAGADAFELRAVKRTLAIFFARSGSDCAAALLAFGPWAAIATLAAEASAPAAPAAAATLVAFAARFTVLVLAAALARLAALFARITRLIRLAAAAFAAVATTTTPAAMTAVAVFALATLPGIGATGMCPGGRTAAKKTLEPAEETAGFFLRCGLRCAPGAIFPIVAMLIRLLFARFEFALVAARFAGDECPVIPALRLARASSGR